MEIPVFVSCPTVLSAEQETARSAILKQLKRYKLAPRALGRSDYPTEYPLREVLMIARRCSGGVILGFAQSQTTSLIQKPGTSDERRIRSTVRFPTPWNQLEAGILFGLRLPLLIFKEDGIEGGVFDSGVTDVFIHPMPSALDSSERRGALGDVFLKWQAEVRKGYYELE